MGMFLSIHSVNTTPPSPLIYRGLRFLKIIEDGDQDFVVKMCGGNPYRGSPVEDWGIHTFFC